MAFAKGKIGVFLEGGYFIDSLKEGVAMSLRALLGEPCVSLGPLPPPDDSVVETILNLIAMQKSVWQVKIFNFFYVPIFFREINTLDGPDNLKKFRISEKM